METVTMSAPEPVAVPPPGATPLTHRCETCFFYLASRGCTCALSAMRGENRPAQGCEWWKGRSSGAVRVFA
jgi:hypothetical protein